MKIVKVENVEERKLVEIKMRSRTREITRLERRIRALRENNQKDGRMLVTFDAEQHAQHKMDELRIPASVRVLAKRVEARASEVGNLQRGSCRLPLRSLRRFLRNGGMERAWVQDYPASYVVGWCEQIMYMDNAAKSDTLNQLVTLERKWVDDKEAEERWFIQAEKILIDRYGINLADTNPPQKGSKWFDSKPSEWVEHVAMKYDLDTIVNPSLFKATGYNG